jgi:hypothetical protein
LAKIASGCSTIQSDLERRSASAASCTSFARSSGIQLAAGAAPCDDIDGLFCVLRDNLGKAEAFIISSSAEYQMEQAPSDDDEEDLHRQSNVEHLVEAGTLAVRAATYTTEEIEDRVQRRRGA